MSERDLQGYEDLTPFRVLDALESLGLYGDGRLLALNSYENRVYMLGMDGGGALVAKFYRPGRWEDVAIQEEHDFALELVENEIPVVPPMILRDGKTLHHFEGHRFAVFPCQGGRAPLLDDPETRRWLGRFLGRIHGVGKERRFAHRQVLGVQSFGRNAASYLLENHFLPLELEKPYRDTAEKAIRLIEDHFRQVSPESSIRLHGDCHAGNVLWTDEGPHFVDLDDCMMGPAIQDLWMLLSGDQQEMQVQLHDILSGYEAFFSFDLRQLSMIESLRTLRMMHYAAWLARRWNDPAFPLAFPWFDTPLYWQKHLQELQEQIALMEAPPLRL